MHRFFCISILWHLNSFKWLNFLKRACMIVVSLFAKESTLYRRMEISKAYTKQLLRYFAKVHVIPNPFFVKNTSFFTQHVFKISFAFFELYNNHFQIKNLLFNVSFSDLRDSMLMAREDNICLTSFFSCSFSSDKLNLILFGKR